VNPDLDTVAGTAVFDPSQYILHTWVHGMDESYMQLSAEGGTWLANFSSQGFDLQPGMGGRVELVDQASNATAVDWYIPSPPRILASITFNWFQAENFTPDTPLTMSIYASPDPGAALLWEETRQTDGAGFVFVGEWEHPVDLVPGHYLVVSDGSTAKDLVLEAVTFDLFDLPLGLLQGTAPEPFGRSVWVGIGWEYDGWSMDVVTDEYGAWTADFGGPVPPDFTWVAAQVFDPDGDASEVYPSQIINGP